MSRKALFRYNCIMFPSNAPEDYICPICLGIQKVESEKTLIKPTDIVYSDDTVTVFINSFFMGKNAGHVIVVPNIHYENIYDLPAEVGRHIFDIAQRMAKTIKKAYESNGITIKQNNEPAGDQHAFHFHLHVFPRYDNDGFNEILPEQKRLAEPKERAEYANKLKCYID
jgi:histidine triad (HIT) family protein